MEEELHLKIKNLETKLETLGKQHSELLEQIHGPFEQEDFDDMAFEELINQQELERENSPFFLEELELDSISNKIHIIEEELGILRRTEFLNNNISKISQNFTKNFNIDSLQRESLANNVGNLINMQDKDSKLSIGILGEWGSGKSTFLNLIETNLEANSNIIRFNASKYDDQEQIWYSLLLAISEKYLSNKKRKCKRFRFLIESAKQNKESFFVYLPIISLVFFILFLSGLIHFSKNDQFLKSFYKTAGTIFFSISSAISGYIAYSSIQNLLSNVKEYFISNKKKFIKRLKYPNYQKNLGTRENVRKDLIVFKNLITKNNNNNLVIMIDELDRCSEQTILNFFSSIEAFIDIPGIIYLFSINPNIVYPAVSKLNPNGAANSIHKKNSGAEFIEKYISVFFTLPSVTTYNLYITNLLDNIVDVQYIDKISSLINLVSDVKNTTPREIKKILDLSLIYHQEFINLSFLEFSTILIIEYYFGDFEGIFSKLKDNSTTQFKNLIFNNCFSPKRTDIPLSIAKEAKHLLSEINMFTIKSNMPKINRILEYT